MTEKTTIFDGSNPTAEHKEQTRIITNREFKEEIRVKAQEQKNTMHTLKNVGLAIGGIGAGMALMGFMPSHPFDSSSPIPIPDNPESATSVTDDMSYQEAFEAARNELGPGHFFTWNGNTFTTYTQEEWSQLDDEDKSEYQTSLQEQIENQPITESAEQIPFMVHDQAPIAESVTDDMSFNDAFAVARNEVGPGGVFEWNGKLYNTYYENEWNSMDSSERTQFAQSIDHANLDNNNISPSNVEHLPEAITVNDTSEELFLTDEYITLDTGETIHVGYFQQGNETIIKLDVDGDNQYDYIVDPETEQLIGLNGNADVDLNQLNENGSSAEDFPEPIMSEYVDVEGYNALVTTFSDGTQQAQIDLDGDGVYDTTLELNTSTGEMNAYDTHGNLIAQDNIMRYDEVESYDSFSDEVNFHNASYETDNSLFSDNQPDDFGNDFNNQIDVSDWA